MAAAGSIASNGRARLPMVWQGRRKIWPLWRLFGRSRVADATLADFFLQPEAVMLTRPVDVDLASAHGLEGALHADRADVDVGQHDGNEQHADDAVHHLRRLHAGDVGCIK